MTRQRMFFSAALVASSILAAASARAEDPSSVVRVEIMVVAPPYFIEAAACSLPVISTGTRVRPFDVRVGDRRCSSTPAPNDAIPLVVQVSTVVVDGSQQVVILEADANGAEIEAVRAGLTVAGDLLKKKIVESSVPIARVVHTERRELEPLSPGVHDAGKAALCSPAA